MTVILTAFFREMFKITVTSQRSLNVLKEEFKKKEKIILKKQAFESIEKNKTIPYQNRSLKHEQSLLEFEGQQQYRQYLRI